MKALIKALPFIIAVVVSCNSSDKWYLGEWTDGENTFTITKTKYSNPGWEQECPVTINETSSGEVFITLELGPEDFYGYDISADSERQKLQLINTNSGPYEGQVFAEYHKKTTETANATSEEPKSKEKKDKSSGHNSDKAWKSAFDSDGYLVLKSEHQYTKLGNTSYIYVVLKGYGDNYKRGKVTVHFGGFIENTGIYDYDDGALVFPEIYTATGYPADGIAIEGRIFNVEFSPTISITEYKEPIRGEVTKIKYSQTSSGDLSGYKQSSNPHPRNR